MFFKPKYLKNLGKCTLSNACEIEGADGYILEVLKDTVAEFGVENGDITRIVVNTKLPRVYKYENTEEGYTVESERGTNLLTICGQTERARLYGAVTLKQLLTYDELERGIIMDYPDCQYRAYRVYLPGREYFDEFKKMVDTLAYYKYNAISLEVGGAMEYKRHPEINAAWKKFADETHIPGRVEQISHMYNWSKNSIHTENAEGEILTQDEVRELVEYCRSRHVEPYPEVPTLSHTDYICLAHPEIAERQNDAYPDTYCPNHPDTYKIVFDIFDEVIDVFKPKVINIGHDEMYSSCICERCKGLDPAEEYAKDITRIYEYLKERGIRTMMWAEKLLPVVTAEGKFYGGAGGRKFRGDKELEPHPVLFYCQKMLPRDIIMLNWYYAFGIQYDYVYYTHGYQSVVYGNLSAANVERWRERKNMGIKGGAPSNWGSNDPVYMQRNCQFSNLIFSAYALWATDYDNSQLGSVMKNTFDEAFFLKYGNLSKKPYILITHTTDADFKYQPYWCGSFIDKEKFLLGNYKVTYTDGDSVSFEVIYGENIASQEIPYIKTEVDNSEFNDVTLTENALSSMSYSTIPQQADGKTVYKTAFLNPHPEKQIDKIEYVPIQSSNVTVCKIEY